MGIFDNNSDIARILNVVITILTAIATCLTTSGLH